MSGWALSELVGAELGDGRLNDRLIRLAERLSERPEASIPQACSNAAETKAAYRFWDNDAISPEEILKPHRRRTANRASQHPVVLAVQDTTEVDFSTHEATEGLGYLACEHARGLLVHSVLCVPPQGRRWGCWINLLGRGRQRSWENGVLEIIALRPRRKASVGWTAWRRPSGICRSILASWWWATGNRTCSICSPRLLSPTSGCWCECGTVAGGSKAR